MSIKAIAKKVVKAPVKLPDVPKGKELEDFVSAALQASGHYIEKNIEEPQVMELDIVATEYLSGLPKKKLYEVKSGDWGFPDVFKILGQMLYLDIPEGT